MRIQSGQEQKARFGYYLKTLNSENAYYINVTSDDKVGAEHSYFKGSTVHDYEQLKLIFKGIFTGKSVEDSLNYQVDSNSYRLFQ